MELTTKTSKAVASLKKGDLKGALKIFRTFRIGFTSAERRVIEIASETLNGYGRIYNQLGIDCNY